MTNSKALIINTTFENIVFYPNTPHSCILLRNASTLSVVDSLIFGVNIPTSNVFQLCDNSVLRLTSTEVDKNVCHSFCFGDGTGIVNAKGCLLANNHGVVFSSLHNLVINQTAISGNIGQVVNTTKTQIALSQSAIELNSGGPLFSLSECTVLANHTNIAHNSGSSPNLIISANLSTLSFSNTTLESNVGMLAATNTSLSFASNCLISMQSSFQLTHATVFFDRSWWKSGNFALLDGESMVSFTDCDISSTAGLPTAATLTNNRITHLANSGNPEWRTKNHVVATNKCADSIKRHFSLRIILYFALFLFFITNIWPRFIVPALRKWKPRLASDRSSTTKIKIQ